MTFNRFGLHSTAAAGMLALSVLTGCDATSSSAPASDSAAGGAATAPALDPILANPQVGDLYAAELTAFSASGFSDDGGNGDTLSKAYGMLKVVAVDDATVTVITENGAWAQSEGAIEELGGDLAGISWDESERIPVQRAELAQMVTDGKILRTRRMEAAAPAATTEATPAGEGKPAASQ